MGYSKFDFTSVHDIEREHSGYWFSPDTLRFFNSRVHEQVYHGKNLIYFVSSEVTGFNSSERRYTVRSYNPSTDTIDTVGEFNGYKSRNGAHSAAARIAASELC